MRCHPGRWWWGLLPVAILIWLALIGEHQAIQADLRVRAGDQLAAAGLPWANSGFSGRDGILIGHAMTSEERARAAEIVGQIWGVRSIENHALLAPGPRIFQWSASRDRATVHLTGHVPSEALRDMLIAKVRTRFPGLSVEDKMTVVRAAPEQLDFLSGATFAIGQLERLSIGGRVDLEGRDLIVEGRAGTSSDYRLVRGELAQNLPGGLRLKDEKVLPPAVSPYVWGANFGDNQLELTGHVPDERQRDEVFAHAKRTFPKATIIDRMVTASGEPREWQTAAMRALSRLGQLIEGTISLTDRRLVMKGLAEKEQTATAVSRALREQVPASFEVADEITFEKPAIPTVTPYVTVIELGESGSRMTGHVPSDEARTAIVAAVKAGTKTGAVRDDSQLGAGADKGWLTCLKAGLTGLHRIGGGRLVLTGRRLELSGQTSDVALIEETTASVRAATNRTCDLVARIALIELPEPDLKWSATANENELVLTGEVPDKPTAVKLAARAKELFPKHTIINSMQVKSSLSAKWPVVALAGLDMLSKLRQGEASIQALVLTVSGQASDTVIAAAIRESLRRDMPHGYSGVDKIEVRSAAMLWADQEAQRKAAEDALRKREAEEAERLKREKAARDAKQKAEADAAAKAAAASAAAAKAAADRVAAAKAAAASAAAAKAATERAAALKAAAAAGTARRASEDKTDDAQVRTERQRQDAARRATELAHADAERAVSELQLDIEKGGDNKSEGREARNRRIETSCRELMRTTVRKGHIRFGRSRAVLRRESYPTLNRLARVVRVCRDATIEIEGHADSDGIASRNQLLSQRRAQAVVDYLVKSGIPRARLKAIGYGVTRPLVPNTTAANKAVNRRIDFAVRMK